MKLLLRIIGIGAVVIGLIWMGQGLKLLPGTFMVGDIRWTYYGGGLALLGALLIYRGWTRRR
jgi:hypothetical protein